MKRQGIRHETLIKFGLIKEKAKSGKFFSAVLPSFSLKKEGHGSRKASRVFSTRGNALPNDHC
jgi:hypothetical protein